MTLKNKGPNVERLVALRSSVSRNRCGNVSKPDSSGRLRAGREGARTTGIKEASSARTYLSSMALVPMFQIASRVAEACR